MTLKPDFNRIDIQRYFDRLCLKFGNSIHSVGWYNHSTQQIRFDMLCKVAPLSGHSILDVGCGIGDLFGYLTHHDLQVSYSGIDLSPEMIAVASKKYPAGLFRVADFLDDSFDQQFDFVLASGAFNFRVSDPFSYYSFVIEKMFSLARVAVAFNLLSIFSPYQRSVKQVYSHCSPADILAICFKHTHKVALFHHYLPNDFTVYMYPS